MLMHPWRPVSVSLLRNSPRDGGEVSTRSYQDFCRKGSQTVQRTVLRPTSVCPGHERHLSTPRSGVFTSLRSGVFTGATTGEAPAGGPGRGPSRRGGPGARAGRGARPGPLTERVRPSTGAGPAPREAARLRPPRAGPPHDRATVPVKPVVLRSLVAVLSSNTLGLGSPSPDTPPSGAADSRT